MWLQGHTPRFSGIRPPQPAGCHSFSVDLSWVDGSHQEAAGAVTQRQSEMPLSWEDEIPPPPLHDTTGAGRASNTVLETFISPCFLKLAIIPTIIIVRIYNKRHNYSFRSLQLPSSHG